MILRCSLVTGTVGALALAVSSAVRADVAFIAILTVPEEHQVEFDALAFEMVEAASENEGLLVYEFARSGNRVFGYERYVDAAAHARHEDIIAGFLPDLMNIADFETIVTLSDLTDEHRQAFQDIGAEIGDPIAGVANGQLGD